MQQINTTLYSLNKDTSIQQWKVFVEGNQIIVEFGKLDGKIQQKITTATGKNIGRSNETTPEQQAVLEAESKWRDQVRKGAKESPDGLSVDKTSVMLAADALKKPNAIQYPCSSMPKADGLRMMVTFDEQGEPVFRSRGNKVYPSHKHLRDQLVYLKNETGIDHFDGELYIHGMPLQKITSLAKKIQEGSENLTYLLFDIPSNKPWMVLLSDCTKDNLKTYGECRYVDLYHKVDYVVVNHADVLTHLNVIDTHIIYNEDEAKADIGLYMEQGYEGLIARNFKGLYEYGQRSNDLIKWKLFQDIETKVVGCEVDKNDEGVLHCTLQNGVKFKAKMKGTHEERLYEKQLQFVGKFVTVKFQQYTADGVPQFPVITGTREVDPLTWSPTE